MILSCWKICLILIKKLYNKFKKKNEENEVKIFKLNNENYNKLDLKYKIT